MNIFKTIPRPQRRRAVLAALLCVWLLLVGSAQGEGLVAKNPYDLAAGFLHAFPSYIEWPAPTKATNLPPWRIAILGDDPFGESLAQACQNRPIKGRSFEIIRALRVEDLPACDIVYLASKKTDTLKEQLAALASRSVLTVGEADDFLKLGGVIQMQPARTMKFSVNLDQARANGLKIHVEMLGLATHIIENGSIKK